MNSELTIAKRAAIEAGDLILAYYKSEYEVKDKGYQNPVTTADHASDARLKDILIQSYPEYGWLSEETLDSKERLKKISRTTSKEMLSGFSVADLLLTLLST